MIEDASARAASRAVAQYVAEHAVHHYPPRHLGRGTRSGYGPRKQTTMDCQISRHN
ncbi:UNVERIFIED_CONTAM: hypothetical protein Sradi_2317600 [Sesamum radiatum]|uniref:Uncharacterized protein n=1 Tax=Sesamum radiatum TaxID=300843 RepID=A0AAW2T581_SESRA